MATARHRNALELCPQATRRTVARCRREVEAAAHLSHPNIVAAYDAVRARGKLVLVMEYVEGVDLGRLVAQAGPLPVTLACEAVRQAALALQYAHDRGLLHCDVKPSNLLLVHPPLARWDADALRALVDGRRTPQIKLLDMGLARRIDDSDGPVGKRVGRDAGLYGPERGHGEPLDGRADLYSLGCSFYHLLTGQPPFPDGEWAEKLLRHRLDSPRPIRTLRPDAPAAIAVVVERLMARDPADRYASAADAGRAIDACGTAEPLRVSKPLAERAAYKLPNSKPLAERAAYKLPKRLRSSLSLALVFVGALLSGAAWCALPPAQQPTTAPLLRLSIPLLWKAGRLALLRWPKPSPRPTTAPS